MSRFVGTPGNASSESFFRTFDNRNTFSSVNLVRPHGMTVQVSNALHFMSRAVDLDLIGLHRFLNCLTDFAKRDVNSARFDSRVGRLARCLEQRFKLRVETHGPRTVDDPPWKDTSSQRQ